MGREQWHFQRYLCLCLCLGMRRLSRANRGALQKVAVLVSLEAMEEMEEMTGSSVLNEEQTKRLVMVGRRLTATTTMRTTRPMMKMSHPQLSGCES